MTIEIGEPGVYNEGMDEEKVCKHCNKPLNADFQFCPYCGSLNLNDHHFRVQEADPVADDKENIEKLNHLEACLDVLDSEISQFLATK